MGRSSAAAFLLHQRWYYYPSAVSVLGYSRGTLQTAQLSPGKLRGAARSLPTASASSPSPTGASMRFRRESPNGPNTGKSSRRTNHRRFYQEFCLSFSTSHRGFFEALNFQQILSQNIATVTCFSEVIHNGQTWSWMTISIEPLRLLLPDQARLQVAEVTQPSGSGEARLSINGWFHSDEDLPRPPLHPPIPTLPTLLKPTEGGEVREDRDSNSTDEEKWV